MKTIFIISLIMFGSINNYCQSIVIFDIGTSLEVGTGSDICGDSLVMNGTYTGNGTICGVILSVNVITQNVPKSFDLFQNYPNPFNPVTKIRFDLPKQADAKLVIYDALGREISVVVNELLEAGSYDVNWNASDLTSGIYFYKLETEGFTSIKKMILVK